MGALGWDEARRERRGKNALRPVPRDGQVALQDLRRESKDSACSPGVQVALKV